MPAALPPLRIILWRIKHALKRRPYRPPAESALQGPHAAAHKKIHAALAEFGRHRKLTNDSLEVVEEWRARLAGDKSPLSRTDFGSGVGGRHKREGQGAAHTETTVAALNAGSSKPRKWARLLYLLVKEWRPNFALELGTCLGVSGAYLATALKENATGYLITVEGSAQSAELARRGFLLMGLSSYIRVVTGSFDAVLATQLHAWPPIDFVFLDGHHRKEPTLRYIKRLRPHMADECLVVLDDIAHSPEMYSCWKELKGGANYSVDMGQVGILLFVKERPKH